MTAPTTPPSERPSLSDPDGMGGEMREHVEDEFVCPLPACPQMLDCITFPCDTCPVWADSDEDDA